MNDNALILRRQPTVGETRPTLHRPTGDAHLKFHLGVQTPAIIATRHLQEAITVPAQRVSPMPNMPACMLGLINRRSRVIWVADLALVLGLSIADANPHQYNLILLQVGTVALALRVHAIEEILTIRPDQIQSPPSHIPASLVPYLRGCILQGSEVLLALDAEAIAQSSALQPH